HDPNIVRSRVETISSFRFTVSEEIVFVTCPVRAVALVVIQDKIWYVMGQCLKPFCSQVKTVRRAVPAHADLVAYVEEIGTYCLRRGNGIPFAAVEHVDHSRAKVKDDLTSWTGMRAGN